MTNLLAAIAFLLASCDLLTGGRLPVFPDGGGCHYEPNGCEPGCIKCKPGGYGSRVKIVCPPLPPLIPDPFDAGRP